MNMRSCGRLIVLFLLLSNVSYAAESYRSIPIPVREHGYSNFESTIIHTQKDLKRFMKHKVDGKDMGWNNRAGFMKAIKKARIDFSRESLVLLRNTEHSGSVRISFQKPLLKDGVLNCRLERRLPEGGTADMAFYAFALLVDKKAVKSIRFQPEKRPVLILKM